MELLDGLYQRAELEKATLSQQISQLNEATQSEIAECGLPYCSSKADKENLPFQLKLLKDEFSSITSVIVVVKLYQIYIHLL
jgi:hypothetical protein